MAGVYIAPGGSALFLWSLLFGAGAVEAVLCAVGACLGPRFSSSSFIKMRWGRMEGGVVAIGGGRERRRCSFTLSVTWGYPEATCS